MKELYVMEINMRIIIIFIILIFFTSCFHDLNLDNNVKRFLIKYDEYSVHLVNSDMFLETDLKILNEQDKNSLNKIFKKYKERNKSLEEVIKLWGRIREQVIISDIYVKDLTQEEIILINFFYKFDTYYKNYQNYAEIYRVYWNCHFLDKINKVKKVNEKKSGEIAADDFIKAIQIDIETVTRKLRELENEIMNEGRTLYKYWTDNYENVILKYLN